MGWGQCKSCLLPILWKSYDSGPHPQEAPPRKGKRHECPPTVLPEQSEYERHLVAALSTWVDTGQGDLEEVFPESVVRLIEGATARFLGTAIHRVPHAEAETMAHRLLAAYVLERAWFLAAPSNARWLLENGPSLGVLGTNQIQSSLEEEWPPCPDPWLEELRELAHSRADLARVERMHLGRALRKLLSERSGS